jgi:hypothetical protein
MTTLKLNTMVEMTRDRWNREAILFCAMHGRKGGAFELNLWANGRLMAEVPGARCNQAITAEDLETLKANNWNIYI